MNLDCLADCLPVVLRRRRMPAQLLVLVVATAGLAACTGVPDERPNVRGATDLASGQAVAEVPAMDGTDFRLAAALARTDAVTPPFRDVLSRFYAGRGYRPIWFPDGHATAATHVLLTVLRDAKDEGLDPADYAPDTLHSDCTVASAIDVAGCELRFSNALLRYAQDVRFGVFAAAGVNPGWHVPRPQDGAELLTAVVATQDLAALLRDLAPPHAGYQRLRGALADLRRAAAVARPLIAPGPALQPGDRGPRVSALRERLGVEPLSSSADVPVDVFDAPLQAAVTAFQASHGLDSDGVVGGRTLAALNQPPAQDIAQVRLNMEHWRWLPRDPGPRHVIVNLAGFELTSTQPGVAPLTLRVIVGRPDRSSPVMHGQIDALVLNPPWTVPKRLAVEDMLPQLRRDPTAMQKKDIHILARRDGVLSEIDAGAVDWQSHHAQNFPFVLRQTPGPANSLGRIKFDMRNPLDIYLHDTPARNLFDKTQRTFSAGCIRVDQPLRLAVRLLGGDTDSAAAYLQRQIDSGRTVRVPLQQPVPVYLVYQTAWVDDDGNLQLREDVYGRDVQLRDRFAFP